MGGGGARVAHSAGAVSGWGACAFVFESVDDTDMIMRMLLQRPDVFPLWAGDVLLVAIISAAMSSMDSVLLVAASVFSRDLLGVVDQRGIVITRRAVLGLAAVSALVALRPPGDIVSITVFSGSLYAACFLPVLLLSLHWRRGHAAAVVSSMAAGAIALLLWLGSGLNAHVHEVFVGFVASLGFFWG